MCLGARLDSQLELQTAALQTWSPSREVKGKIERFRFTTQKCLRIVLPGSEIQLCRKKVMPIKGDDGGQGLHLVKACNRLTCIQKTG